MMRGAGETFAQRLDTAHRLVLGLPVPDNRHARELRAIKTAFERAEQAGKPFDEQWRAMRRAALRVRHKERRCAL